MFKKKKTKSQEPEPLHGLYLGEVSCCKCKHRVLEHDAMYIPGEGWYCPEDTPPYDRSEPYRCIDTNDIYNWEIQNTRRYYKEFEVDEKGKICKKK